MATSLRAAVNKREQQLYQEYLNRLRSKDAELLHTPDGEVGPLERGFTSATNPEDFKGWVLPRVLQRVLNRMGWPSCL